MGLCGSVVVVYEAHYVAGEAGGRTYGIACESARHRTVSGQGKGVVVWPCRRQGCTVAHVRVSVCGGGGGGVTNEPV